jgi:outer membrane protein OmpA-like peptidoglycan-associated protein
MSAHARRRAVVHGEGDDKAFWISFADLMTALMVLFLVVMAVALLTITRAQTSPSPSTSSGASTPVPKPAPPTPKTETAKPVTPEIEEINKLIQQVAAAVDAAPGVRFDARRHVIDFGDRARFETGSHRLDSASAKLLRDFVPQLLAITQTELGQRWVRRVVVEGFADPRGNYLYNLNLSLQRAERVICTLLDGGGGSGSEGSALNDAQRMQVKGIFAVGGFSFNDQRASLDASRRIEMRIEFGPPPASLPARPADDTGSCRLAG